MDLTKKVVQSAGVIGVERDELMSMVTQSARVTHRFGNRRYKDFIFSVTSRGLVQTIHLIKCTFCYDNHKINIQNECEKCFGKGCKSCDQGFINGQITCPECN